MLFHIEMIWVWREIDFRMVDFKIFCYLVFTIFCLKFVFVNWYKWHCSLKVDVSVSQLFFSSFICCKSSYELKFLIRKYEYKKNIEIHLIAPTQKNSLNFDCKFICFVLTRICCDILCWINKWKWIITFKQSNIFYLLHKSSE